MKKIIKKKFIYLACGIIIIGIVVYVIQNIKILRQCSHQATGYVNTELYITKKPASKYVMLAKKLVESPVDFVNKEIKLQGNFEGNSDILLNYRISDNPEIYFPSTKYLQFYLFTPEHSFPRCFVEKSKGEKLYKLDNMEPITIWGKIVSSYGKHPWIEISRIEKGWK